MAIASTPLEGPLGTIADCHARTLSHCAVLRRLVLHLGECGCDAWAQQAGRQILHHFDAAARQNHAEEEQFLFPTLLESMAGSDAVCLREMTSGLTRQHRVLEQMWDGLREPVRAIATGESEHLDAIDVEAFIEATRQDIDRETSELLPMASRLFTDHELAYLRQVMHDDRGPGMAGAHAPT